MLCRIYLLKKQHSDDDLINPLVALIDHHDAEQHKIKITRRLNDKLLK